MLPVGSTRSLTARPLFHNTQLAKKSSPFLADTDVSWGSLLCRTPAPSSRLLLAIADGLQLVGRLVGHLWCLWKKQQSSERGKSQQKVVVDHMDAHAMTRWRSRRFFDCTGCPSHPTMGASCPCRLLGEPSGEVLWWAQAPHATALKAALPEKPEEEWE